jgi:hypothetical protein
MTDKAPAPSKETDSIQVENFNGLNLVASPLNIPYEESPNIINCAIDPGGAIQSRGGTALVLSTTAVVAANAVIDIDYQTPDGFNWVFRKIGRDLYIYQLVNDTLTLYANGGTNPLQIAAAPVWSVAAANVVLDYAASSESSPTNPRIFLTSGVDSTKVVSYTIATQLFSAAVFAPTGAPANWTGTNHPRTVAIWDGRLYLAGTPNSPATVWASKAGVFDDFTASPLAADIGFALALYAQSEQRIVKLFPYRNALVIFSRRGLFTLTPATFVSGSGSSTGVVTYNNFKITNIASLGAVNAQCVTPVENTLHFLSDTGVYELTESTDPSSPYQAGELTIKLAPLFKDIPTAPLELSKATYDPSRREYWLCLPDKGGSSASKIFLYKIQRKAWTQYELTAISKKTVIRSIRKVFDTTGRSRIIMVVEGGTNAFHTLAWNADRVGSYTDFTQTFTGNGSTLSFTHAVSNILRPLFTYAVAGFATNLIQTDFIFDSLGSTQDLTVKVNGVVSTAYLKVGEDKIQFTSVLPIGTIIDVQYTPRVNLSVVVDNIEQDPTAFTYLNDTVTFATAPANNSVVKISVVYRCIYDTYEFNFGSLRNRKRLRYLYLYAKALEDLDVFTASDVNTLSNQDPASLVFLPKTQGQLDIRYWKDGKTLGTTLVGDVYYNPAGVWDIALWDQVFPAGYTSNELKVGLQGVCFYVQVRLFSRSSGAFSIPGYQLDIHHKGRR